MSTPQDAASTAAQPPSATKTKQVQQQATAGGSKRSKLSNKGGRHQQAQPSGGDRERSERGGGAAAQQKLKIVVRRLPANIPEDIFWASTAEWVNDETAGWKTFRKGKVAKSDNKEPTHSRAYILFKSQAALLEFHRSYDGHLFRDKAGNESVAVVEYAVYQKVPVVKPKPDPKAGSIDSDPDYLSFLESLKPQPKIAVEDHVPLPVNPSDTQKQKITPLLEHLKARKAAQIASKGGPAAVAAAAAAAAAPQLTAGGKKGKGKEKKAGAASAAEPNGQATAGQGQGKKKKGAKSSAGAVAGVPGQSTTATPTATNAGKQPNKKKGGLSTAAGGADGQAPKGPSGKKSAKLNAASSPSATPPAGPSRQNSSTNVNIGAIEAALGSSSVAQRQAQAAAALVSRQPGSAPSPGADGALPPRGQGNARSKRRETRKGASKSSGGGVGGGEDQSVSPQNVPGGNVFPGPAKPKITLLQRDAASPSATPPPAILDNAGNRPTAPAFVPGQSVNVPQPSGSTSQPQNGGAPSAGSGRSGGGRNRNGGGRSKAKAG